MTISINIIVTIGIGVIITGGGFLLRKAIFDKIDTLTSVINQLNNQFTTFEKDVIKDYVRKEDFSKNEVAHEKLWVELNGTKQRVATLEALESKKD